MRYQVLLFLTVFITLSRVHNGESGNILGLFHFPSPSHHIVGSALLKELARRGHNVTMVSPYPLKEKLPNYTDVALKGMTEFKEEYLETAFVNASAFKMMSAMYNSMPVLNKLVLQQESMQNLLNSSSQFDLIIIFYPLSEQFFPLAHHFKAPLVLFTSVGTMPFINEVAGNLNFYSYVPNMMSTFSDQMTFSERLINTGMGLLGELVYNTIIYPQQARLAKEAFPNSPPLDQVLANQFALAFVNSHYSTETPRPYTPNIIQIGGFHVQDPDSMPEKLKKYLDDAKEGVIYFSFGSNLKVQQLQQDKLDVIMKILGRYNVKVLWKSEIDVKGLPKNFKIERWLPQKSILSHPNVKAFITHGGLGSIVESMYAGVPMIATPFFGDQKKNVADIVKKQYGVSLEFNDITEESFSHAVNEILNNPTYQEKVRGIASLLNDRPAKPMDTAVYWVEHVIKHKGAKHLQPASRKLNIVQQLLLDVIGTLILGAVIALFVIYYIVKVLFKLICRCCKRSKSKEKEA